MLRWVVMAAAAAAGACAPYAPYYTGNVNPPAEHRVAALRPARASGLRIPPPRLGRSGPSPRARGDLLGHGAADRRLRPYPADGAEVGPRVCAAAFLYRARPLQRRQGPAGQLSRARDAAHVRQFLGGDLVRHRPRPRPHLCAGLRAGDLLELWGGDMLRVLSALLLLISAPASRRRRVGARRRAPGRVRFLCAGPVLVARLLRAGGRREGQGAMQVGANLGFVLHGLWPQNERGLSHRMRPRQPQPLPPGDGHGARRLPLGGAGRHQWRKHAPAPAAARPSISRSRSGRSRRSRFRRSSRKWTASASGPRWMERAFVAANRGLRTDMMSVACRAASCRRCASAFRRTCARSVLAPRVDQQGCRTREDHRPADALSDELPGNELPAYLPCRQLRRRAQARDAGERHRLSSSRNPRPFRVIVTHAGAGRYDLSSEKAQRTGGVARGRRRMEQAFDALLRGLSRAWALGARRVRTGAGSAAYPGSPLIVQAVLRARGRLCRRRTPCRHLRGAPALSAGGARALQKR